MRALHICFEAGTAVLLDCGTRKQNNVLHLNDGKIRMRHGEEMHSDFTFLYFEILLFKLKT